MCDVARSKNLLTRNTLVRRASFGCVPRLRATYIGRHRRSEMIVAPDDVPLPLLERYAIGQCTPEDLAELEAWIGGQPERRLFLERLQLLFARPAAHDSTVTFTASEIEQAWGRLADRMSSQATQDRERTARREKVAAIAAGCVAVIVVLWLIFSR